jgi:hypothetical protein
MTVYLQNVQFTNTTGINNIPLTIEAPFGTVVYGPTPQAAGAVVDIPIMRDDCASVRLKVDDPDHPTIQDFIFGAGNGRPLYFVSVIAQYAPGDITGTVNGQTGP